MSNLDIKHPIPYETVKRLERNAYKRGYRKGKEKPEKRPPMNKPKKEKMLNLAIEHIKNELYRMQFAFRCKGARNKTIKKNREDLISALFLAIEILKNEIAKDKK